MPSILVNTTKLLVCYCSFLCLRADSLQKQKGALRDLLKISILAQTFILLLTTAATAFAEGTDTVSQYDLAVTILPNAHRLEVAGTWRLPASATERAQIEFYLSPKMAALNVQLLEPKASAPLNLVSSQEEGGDTKWIFKPTWPVPVGQTILLQLSYASDGKPAPQFNISPEGSFAGGGGELWYPQIAFKNRETGTLRFKVPTGETAVSNGVLESTPQQRANGEFIFRISNPSKFAFASGKYTVTRRQGEVSFNLYLLHPRAHAQAMLDECAKTLDFLTGLFGKFPYPEFSLVEVNFPTIVRGTSEFGLIFADRSKLDDFDLSYWAHELGHQWWGIMVKSAPKTTGQMMLSEGVTQFSGLRAIEAVEGQAAVDQFRRAGYRGKGQSAAYYFKLARAGTDFPLTSYLPKNPDETLTMHKLANSKGFILLDMLSRRIGPEKFAAILRRFVQQKTNQTTSWQEFQRAIEADAGQDIHWFFEQWFERTGAPDYQLSWKVNGGRVQGVITQPAPYYRATLEIELKGSRRSLVKKIEVTDGSKSFSWLEPFKVSSLILDPHYRVLRWTPEFKAEPGNPASLKEARAKKGVGDNKRLRKEFTALYARQVAVGKTRDVKAIMEFNTVDYSVKLLNGNTVSRQQLEQGMSRYFTSGQLVRQISFGYRILETTVNGEEVIVLVEQRDRRIQMRRDGKPHKVEANVIHRDTWIKTSEGWKRRLTEEVKQTRFTVDDKPVNPGK
jgi:peptidase M1-like protein